MLLLAKKIEFGEYLLWIGVCLGVVTLASLAVLWYRRRVLGSAGMDVHAGLLDELRAMKNRGEISEEEFNATKHAMAARAAGSNRTRTKPKPVVTGERVAAPGFDLTGQPLPRPPDEQKNTPGV